jgi:hypothetical protein
MYKTDTIQEWHLSVTQFLSNILVIGMYLIIISAEFTACFLIKMEI